jgi:hypothetical protein
MLFPRTFLSISHLHRVPTQSTLRNLLVRNAATLTETVPDVPETEQPARILGRKPRRQHLRVREGQSAKVYFRAIPPGKNHVYDQALRVIVQDAAQLRKEIRTLQPLLEEARARDDAEQIKSLSSKLHILEIQSQINLPRVRWRFIRGTGLSSQTPSKQ